MAYWVMFDTRHVYQGSVGPFRTRMAAEAALARIAEQADLVSARLEDDSMAKKGSGKAGKGKGKGGC